MYKLMGGVIGSLVGGWLVYFGECFALTQMAPSDNTSVGVEVIIFIFALAFLLGAIVAVGSLTQRLGLPYRGQVGDLTPTISKS